MVSYTKIFDPPMVDGSHREGEQEGGASHYVYTERAVLVINTALVTGRPVLIRGRSGTGKTSLARDVAEVLGWRFEKETITSATEAEHLKWRVDFVERLAIAQTGQDNLELLELRRFVRPGPLWRGFDGAGAAQLHDTAVEFTASAEAVVLLDEIDKADPDLPNGLLEPLEDGEFRVPPADGHVVERSAGVGPNGEKVYAPLVFATTNEERVLPKAFLRRCLELRVDYPSKERMASIAAVHELDAAFEPVWNSLFGADGKMTISPAEFLDTAQAYVELGSKPELLEVLQEITAWKHGHSRQSQSRDDDVD